LEGGALICWGRNTWGQLGFGHLENIGDDEIPTSLVEIEEPVEEISLGRINSCARTGANVRCWGPGDGGANGQANTEDIGDDETPIDIPPIVLGLEPVQITYGRFHGCVLSNEGEVMCWGKNDDHPTPAEAGPVPLW
jgi:alpha-tubulin suppressor-like RCC1 family protein